jgi:hypothetical protein
MSDADGLLLGPLPEPYHAALTAVYEIIKAAHSIRLLLAQPPTSGTDAHADLHRLLRLWSDVRRGYGLAQEAYRKAASRLAIAGGPVHFDAIHASSAHEAALEYQRLLFIELESVIDMPSVSRWAGRADEALKGHLCVPPPDERLLAQLHEAHSRFASLQLPEAKAIIAAMRVEAVKAAAQTPAPAGPMTAVSAASVHIEAIPHGRADATGDGGEEQTPAGGDLLHIASDVPDLGAAHSIAELAEWCDRHREGLRQFRVRLGEPPPARVAPAEFRCIPEIVRQCRQYLLGFGASDIPERFAFSALPDTQTPTGPEHFASSMEAFIAWASGYRAPGHGLMKLIGDVEDFLTWAMAWCNRHSVAARPPADQPAPTPTIEEGAAPEHGSSAGPGECEAPTHLAQAERKQPIPKAQAEILVRDYLNKHKGEKPTARDVSAATGVSLGALPGLPPWQVYQAQKKSEQLMRPPGRKTQRLTQKMLEAIGKVADPSEHISTEEAAWRFSLESASPEEKARLNALKPQERAEYINLVIKQFVDQNDDEE